MMHFHINTHIYTLRMSGYVVARVVPRAAGESKCTCIYTWSLRIHVCRLYYIYIYVIYTNRGGGLYQIYKPEAKPSIIHLI